MSDIVESLDIEQAAEAALSTLVPEKSKHLYEKTYDNFETWAKEKHIENFTEKVLLAYFLKLSTTLRPSTLWSKYSMLRTMIYLNKNVDICKFTNLIAFLKRKATGYQPKKSKIFTKLEIERFIKQADDKEFLLAKVVLIVGVFGACRREEITFLKLDAIKDCQSFISVKIPNTKTHVPRMFTITEGSIDGINFLDLFRKYAKLRPLNTTHQRFFLTYRSGKCCTLPVGINTIGGMPKKIAEFLGLPNTNEYTGHCFRRSSATMLADSGADMTLLKRHGGWRSSSVAEGYIENSIEQKNEIAKRIIGQKDTPNTKIKEVHSEAEVSIVSTSSLSIPTTNNYIALTEEKLDASRIQFNSLHNCTFNIIYNK